MLHFITQSGCKISSLATGNIPIPYLVSYFDNLVKQKQKHKKVNSLSSFMKNLLCLNFSWMSVLRLNRPMLSWQRNPYTYVRNRCYLIIPLFTPITYSYIAIAT